MKQDIDSEIFEIDDIFYSLFRYLSLIRHVNPINVQTQKELFFSNKVRNPVFNYKTPRKNIWEIRSLLENLKLPNSDLGKIFEKTKQIFLTKCDIIENIGSNDSIVKEKSAQVYGWPNVWLVNFAKEILKKIPPKTEELNVSSSDIFYSLEHMAHNIGLSDWKIKYSNKWVTRTKNNKQIVVCKNRSFSELDINRLAIHEVGVHAVRYANAYNQPLKIFVYGFPGFLKTEEGLAVYMEELTGNFNKKIFRDYAARVIAVDCLRRNLDFRDCFNHLKTYGFTDEESWNLALRVFRGGGFVKDHIYLEGYLFVKNFVRLGGDIKKLFVGKVGIEDLNLLDELSKEGLVNEPKYFPPFLQN